MTPVARGDATACRPRPVSLARPETEIGSTPAPGRCRTRPVSRWSSHEPIRANGSFFLVVVREGAETASRAGALRMSNRVCAKMPGTESGLEWIPAVSSSFLCLSPVTPSRSWATRSFGCWWWRPGGESRPRTAAADPPRCRRPGGGRTAHGGVSRSGPPASGA